MFKIVLAKQNGLMTECHEKVNKFYKEKYNVSLNIDSPEPFPNYYFVALNNNKIIACCGIYAGKSSIARFDYDRELLKDQVNMVELTKLVVDQEFRGKKIGLLLTMTAAIHHLQRGMTIIFHSDMVFIEKVLDLIKVNYEIVYMYPKNSDIYKVYNLQNLYLSKIEPYTSKL